MKAARQGSMKVKDIMSARPVEIREGASLDEAMDLMDDRDVRHLPVLGPGGLTGVISDRDLLVATGWLLPRERELLEAPTGTVGDFMRSPAHCVEPQADLDAALGLMVQARIGCLPVMEDGCLLGVVTEMDVLRAYSDACRRGRVRPADDPPMREVMTRDPLVVGPEVAGDEAAASMRASHLRHLPVVKGGELIGILSDRDVCRLRGRGQLELTLVGEMMTPNPERIEADHGLSSAALLLSAERISALPVLEGSKLVGIATMIDVMLAGARVLRALERGPSAGS